MDPVNVSAKFAVRNFQARSQDFCKGGHDDGGTEGPERGAEARSAGWGLGRGAVAPPQYGGLGAMPPENFRKINVEIAHFRLVLATSGV